MVRILALGLLGLLLGACAPELNWRELRATEAGVAQLFPCKPVRQQRQAMLAGQPYVLVLEVCEAAGATWAMTSLRAGAPAAVPSLLELLAAAAHANLAAARAPAQPQPVAGAAAYPASGRYRLHGRTPDGRAMQAAILLYARGTTIVQLTVLGPQLADEAVETFLASARADS